jgi:hypothetical protein
MKGVLVCLATLLPLFAQNQKPADAKAGLSTMPGVRLRRECHFEAGLTRHDKDFVRRRSRAECKWLEVDD